MNVTLMRQGDRVFEYQFDDGYKLFGDYGSAYVLVAPDGTKTALSEWDVPENPYMNQDMLSANDIGETLPVVANNENADPLDDIELVEPGRRGIVAIPPNEDFELGELYFPERWSKPDAFAIGNIADQMDDQ